MKIFFKTSLKCSFEKVKNGFNKELFLYLTPPLIKAKVLRFDGCKTGDQVHLEINQLGKVQMWESLITHHSDTPEEWSFVDEGKLLPKPLSNWKHHHRVVRIDSEQTTIIDDIEFDCHPKMLGPIIYPFLWASFAIRPSRYRTFFRD